MMKVLPTAMAACSLLFVSIAPTIVDARDRHNKREHHYKHHENHGHKDRNKAAVAAAVIIGIAAAAAAAKNRDERYGYTESTRFRDRPNVWFPKPGITCYRRSRACYKAGHGYSARWTRREFH